MKSFVALSLALVLAGCSKPSDTKVDPNGPVEVVVPDHGAYTGAFMDFGDAEDDVTLETIEDFEEMVGKHQAIIVSSSYWGEQNFPTANLNVIWRHGSLPLVFWSPWDKPYEEDRGPGFWPPNDCRVRCRNERHVVSVVGRLLWRRGLGPGIQELERPGNVSARVPIYCGPRPC